MSHHGDQFLRDALQQRKEEDSLRRLRLSEGLVDFCSNDYLGLAQAGSKLEQAFAEGQTQSVGSTGSRLLAGNHSVFEETERMLAVFHETEAALLFNSGYDANLGLLSSVAKRGDVILYDRLSHASIRDGIRLSFATSHAFPHNDLNALEYLLKKQDSRCFVVTESVFSMDGDTAPLSDLADLCDRYGALLIVDEAHATGVVGDRGEGLVQRERLHEKVWARIHTFGKALGCHGAVVAGSAALKEYLVNFARSLIYTTALPPASVAVIQESYRLFPGMRKERRQLHDLIERFRESSIAFQKLDSRTPIQGVVVPGNREVKELAERLQRSGLDVRPILYPTVPKGEERLRIVLHSYNTIPELDGLLGVLKETTV